ncbi:MAG: hypothetical protein Q8P99_02540 [bacterium]|nr:hypothetical protein [bacterium]MDZ4231406.1 hypothetical protein [Patescibacteria group bacterium]
MKIIDLGPDKAVTIFSTVRIVRDHPTKALTPVDLENHISQAVWKFYNECREEAAKRLDKSEVDLVLCDARVVGVKIDGHQVINPSGFTGRELEIRLCISMSAERTNEQDLVVEGGSVRAHILSSESGLDRAYYTEIGERQSHIFCVDAHKIAYLNGFAWGREHIDRAIRERLDLDTDAAYLIYEQFASGAVSEKMNRFVGKAFWDTFSEFMNALSMNIRNDGGLKLKEVPPVYINAQFKLPEQVFRKHYAFGKKKFRLQEPPVELDLNIFLKDGLHGVYEELNQLARRRIKWATPPGE